LNNAEVVSPLLAEFSTPALNTSRLPGEHTATSRSLPEQLTRIDSAQRKRLLSHYLAGKLAQILENKLSDSINTYVSLTELDGLADEY
ncbi:MAG: hypothetical protein KDJ52_25765, partial [Anaerolineae bacterium]|nr:hypothetical protein [Anaerolineae bacterium]